MNPFAMMTVEQIAGHVRANGTDNEEEARFALLRLAELAVGHRCHPLARMTLTLLADMPGLVAAAYANELEGDATVEEDDTTRAILLCAVAVLRTNEER